MTSLVLGIFTLELFLTFLLWASWVVLNLWIWQKSKATGNLLMMIGAALFTLVHLLILFNADLGDLYRWLPFFGLVVLTLGFYLSVKPMVAAQLGALGAKFKPANPPASNPPPKP